MHRLVSFFSAYVGDTKWLHGLDLPMHTTSAQKTGDGPDGQAGGSVRVSAVSALSSLARSHGRCVAAVLL